MKVFYHRNKEIQASGKISYSEYQWNKKDWCLSMFAGCMLLLIVSYLFYDSIFGMLILWPFLILYMKKLTEQKKLKKIESLREGFKETLLSLAASMRAGYSLENAIVNARKDLENMYIHQDNPMKEELRVMGEEAKLNITIEKSFEDLARRSGIEEIRQFTTVLQIARRSGGNLVQILYDTSESIVAKLEVEQEIQEMIAGKKYEKNIMCVMPFFILLYLRITNGAYIQALYRNLTGCLVMTVAFAGLVAAYIWADQVMNIEI